MMNGKSFLEGFPMSFTELLPLVGTLPRSEKFRLVQVLIDQLAKEEAPQLFCEGHTYPIWTPDYAPNAASQLAQALEEARKDP
jgi:hypothetical protein